MNPNTRIKEHTMSNTAVQAAGTDRAGSSVTPSTQQDRAMLPPVDVIEDATGITLYADLPGVSRERLNLRVERDTLTIEGELSLPVPHDLQAGHAEVQAPRYRRSFTLSKELDADKIGAELSQGVLRVRIPKAEHAQPRRIQVVAA
jgi:HSP20 family molecular chaperone IbpA